MGVLRKDGWGARHPWLRRRIVGAAVGEDGEILHGESKDEETGGDDGQGDGDFRPLWKIVVTGGGEHAGDGDVHAIGDEAEKSEYGAEIEPGATDEDAAFEEQDRGHEEQSYFEIEEVCFGAALPEKMHLATADEINEAHAEIEGKNDGKHTAKAGEQ